MKKFISVTFIFVFSLIILLPKLLYAQEVDIVQYLKQIENGNKTQVENQLSELKKNYPNSSNLLYLEGVLTANGQQAVAIYNKLVKNYPKSKYADASLYRIYSYYYALGMYNAANNFLDRLKREYPNSPYNKIAKRYIPQKDSLVIASRAQPAGNRTETKNKTSDKNEKYFFTIQAGAFTVKGNAESLMEEFKKDGLYSSIDEKTVGGTTFHVVYVGKYSNEADASKSLKQINVKYNINGRIVKQN
jgi:tetratricopeptide (TPR) repeat protein